MILNQKGVVHLLTLLILLGGIVGVVYLVTQGPLKIFPKAGPGVNIEFVDSQGLAVKTTSTPKVTFKINFPSETYFAEESTSSPITLEPAAVVLSEDPRQTVNMRKYPFTGQYSVLERYTFSTSNLGMKTLYAQFIMKNGKRVNANPYPATIELVALPKVPQNGLVAYWNMDEISGQTVADQSGNGNNGTAVGTTIESSLINLGNTRNFNGTKNSRIELGDNVNLELISFTIAGWIKLNGECGFNTCPILSKGQSGNIGYSLELTRVSGGSYKAVLNINDSQDKVIGTTSLVFGQWYHIVGTSDGTTLSIYVDSVKEGEKSQSVKPRFGAEVAKIGSRNGGSDVTTNGSIDEVGIWSKALSQTEIDALYKMGNKPMPTSSPAPSPSPTPINPSTTILNKKVMLVMYNPTLSNGQKLYQSRGWNDPYKLTDQIISSLNTASGGMVDYQIVETQERNEFPKKIDGFRYTESTYNTCRSNTSTCHNPDAADYNQMWTDLNICSKVSSGQIDTVFVWGAGYFGFDEYAFKIPGDKMPYNTPTNYWFYNGRKKNIPDCNGKTVVVLGWIPEVGEDNALHSFGHWAENALGLTLGRGYWDGCIGHNGVPSDFDQFSCSYPDITPSTPVQQAGCGNVHSPPNTNAGYDYGNTGTLANSCGSWYSYPFQTRTVKNENCNSWGCSQLSYMKWWFDHMPRETGVNSGGNLNNWWKYLVDFDKAVTEAKGTPFP